MGWSSFPAIGNRLGPGVARMGLLGVFNFLPRIPCRGRWAWALVERAGLDERFSGTEIGPGVYDPAHLVEPPGRALTAAWPERPGASRDPTRGHRGNLEWQPGGGGGGGVLVEIGVRTVHATRLEDVIRQWLSKGSSRRRCFFQTFYGQSTERDRRIVSGPVPTRRRPENEPVPPMKPVPGLAVLTGKGAVRRVTGR